MSLTSIDEISKRCQQLELEEKLLKDEIVDLLAKESDYELSMNYIRRKLPNIQYLRTDANQLTNQINFTANLSSTVSYKVRQLDLVKSRVSQCLQRVGDILDLKYCFDGIQKALNSEDYEQGAAHIHRFLSMDENVLRNSTQAINNGQVSFNSDSNLNDDNAGDAGDKIVTSSSIDEAFIKLHEAQQTLNTIIMKKFDEAVGDNDVASVERFFKIFPLLNQHSDGLRKFANYLVKKINEQLLHSSNESHITQLSNLFQCIAKIIDIHQPLIETYYGAGNLITVIEILQKECDQRSKRIIDDFKIVQSFSQITSSISKSLKLSSTSSSSTNVTSKIDPREIDQLLSNIMLLNSRTYQYFKFIKQRSLNDIEIAFSEEQVNEKSEQLSRLNDLERNCVLSHLVHDLNGVYVLLEEYFLHESCSKAIQLDDIDTSGVSGTQLTSSMLDDVFFIVKKCIKRAVSGGSIDVLCAIINHSVIILEINFSDAINEHLRYGYPSSSSSTITGALDLTQAYNVIQTGRYLQSFTDIEKTKLIFLTSLNNLDTACDWIKTLRNSVADDIKQQNILSNESKFSGKSEDVQSGTGNSNLKTEKQDAEKFDSCMSDLLSIIGKYQSLITSGLSNLCSSVLKPRIKTFLDAFTAVSSHNLTENDLLNYEASDGLRSFTQTFIINVDSLLKSFQQSLTINNYSNLISVFLTEFTQRFEKTLLKCQFNKFGGFQFDRELRAIINYLTASTNWSIRDKFSRLKHIAIILNLETVNEISEYFNSNYNDSKSTPWRLTPNEVRQVMKLRNDFSPEEIRKVKL